MIYEPAEDSYLLEKTLRKFLKNKLKNKEINKKIKIFDLGSGSGILALSCKKLGFNNILTADINPEAVDHLKKLGFKSKESNLFSNIKKTEKFNLIIFNPPYLPHYKGEPKSLKTNITAGKKGYEIIVKFLEQAKSLLKNQGSILLLFSSLSQPKIILKQAKDLGYNYNLLNQQKFFFEELYVFELTKE